MLKGKKFTAADLPHRHRLTEEEVKTWCDQQTKRYEVVADDPVKGPLIREELNQVALNKLSPKARRIAGGLMRLPVEVRQEIIKAFTAEGVLRYPFKMR